MSQNPSSQNCSVFGYRGSGILLCFFDWKVRKLSQKEYSYHQKNGIKALLYAFIFVIFIETFAIHLLVERWSNTFAWLLTLLSFYTSLQVFALLCSLNKRPIVIDSQADKLILRYGFFSEVSLDLKDIFKIELNSKLVESDKKLVQLSPLGSLGGHNLILYLKNEQLLHGFYGIQKNLQLLPFTLIKKQNLKVKLRIT